MSRSRVRFPSRAPVEGLAHGACVEAVVDVRELLEELGGALVELRQSLEPDLIDVGNRLCGHPTIFVRELAFERGEITFPIAARRHGWSRYPVNTLTTARRSLVRFAQIARRRVRS